MKPGGRAAVVGVGVGLVSIVAVVYSGAHQPVACPAVARVNVVDVRIAGDPAAVHDVRLCTTGGCSSSAAEALGPESPGARTPGPSTSGPQQPQSPQPQPPTASATPDSSVTPTGTAPPRDSAGDPIPAFPTGPETPAPAAPTTGPHFAAPPLSIFNARLPGTWTFETQQEYPTRVSATAYGADGRALASRVVDLRWRRSAPGDVCDVSRVTGPVSLHVGS